MSKLPYSLQTLIDQFSKLPGVGPKSASRLALHITKIPENQVEIFAQAVLDAKRKVKTCSNCFNLSEDPICSICDDPKREQNKILVVEDPLDLIAFESTSGYTGKYHVLGGVISPINGIGPDQLTINHLIKRIRSLNFEKVEVILATNPNLEGEATAIYIKQILEKIPSVEATRIARGVPTGADLDYTDKQTLLKALQNRTTI